MNKNKIKILVIVGNLGAVAQVRLISPLTFMKNKGLVEFKIVELSKEEDNQINYILDILFIQRINNIIY